MFSYRQVSAQDYFLKQAKKSARLSSDKQVSVGAVLVREGKVLTQACNSVKAPEWFITLHAKGFCIRKWLRIPSGKHYFLCAGCAYPKNHPEQKLVRWAKTKKIDLTQCEVYLWGHYTCCPSCTKVLSDAGIAKVIILNQAFQRFRAHCKTHNPNPHANLSRTSTTHS